MLPSAVNDTMRDMMAQIRDVGDGIRGGTYTMTAPVITGGSITGVALSGNTLTNPVITGGSINNTTVGATTRSTGAFTTLASNGATTFTAGTASTSTTTGTAVITGGLGVSGRINAANFDGIIGANTAAAGNFTTLGATGVATFSAGTVSAPAITTTGDTNTGIFFPAADTIAFTEGGVESMRIDASGNLGIGTTSPATKLNLGGTSDQSIQINGSGTAAYLGTSTSVAQISSNRNPTTGAIYDSGRAVSYINLEAASGNSNIQFYTTATNNVNPTERMRITSAGNVGIGTSSPTAITNFKSVSINGTSGSLYDSFVGGTLIGRIQAEASLYFISAHGVSNPLLLGTNNTERMRIDSSGNVGIGTTSPANKLAIAYTSAAPSATPTNAGINFVGSSSVQTLFGSDPSSPFGAWVQTTNGAGSVFPLNLNPQGGNVGIGTSSPTEKLDVNGSSVLRGPLQAIASSANGVGITVTNTSQSDQYLTLTMQGTSGSSVSGWDNSAVFEAVANSVGSGTRGMVLSAFNGPIIFQTSGRTERMRIDTSGNLLVGTTDSSISSGAGVKFRTDSPRRVAVVSAESTGAGGETYLMYSTGASAFRFYVNWGGTIFATSTTITAISDQRLKENVRDLDDGLTSVMALKPRKFDWKEGKGKNIKGDRGFIAQEFETVFPDMIDEWKDPAPEGEEPYKAVNANLIPTLVKAIQEQQTLINNLTTRLNALEGK
jgi:hypothetical protein